MKQLTKEQEEKGIELLRKEMGISGDADKKSIMASPEESRFVNIAKYCLHLWYSTENPIPDFDAEIFGMRTI